MRDPSEAAGLQNAGAGCHLDDPAIRIADPHEAATTLPGAADETRQQYRPNHASEKPTENLGDRFEGALGRGRWQGYSLANPVRIGGQNNDLATASIVPSSDSTGMRIATASAAGWRREYQGRTLSQKCRPIIA